MPLTDTQIRAAKAKEKKYKLSDGGGLQLHVSPAGTKLWRLAYRYLGKQKEIALGEHPTVSLADARGIREKVKQTLRDGRDPAQEKRMERINRAAAQGYTFAAIADELRAKLEKEERAPATLARHDWIFELYLKNTIGPRPVSELRAPEVLHALKKIEDRGRHETASRARRLCSQVFRLAIATGRLEHDPTQHLRGALVAAKPQNRASITDPRKLGGLLRSIDIFEGQATTMYALRMLPYVFVRPFEIRHAEWREIDFDNAIWRIAANKMKMRREHIVPLANQVVDLLKGLQPLTSYSRYVFPSLIAPDRPLSENTLNSALRRLGYEKDEICTHGFRHTASTMLNEQGFNRDWIERQLAHVDGDSVRGAYNAALYLEGRRTMMQWWADRLDELREFREAA